MGDAMKQAGQKPIFQGGPQVAQFARIQSAAYREEKPTDFATAEASA